jgi:hypothetical protein
VRAAAAITLTMLLAACGGGTSAPTTSAPARVGFVASPTDGTSAQAPGATALAGGAGSAPAAPTQGSSGVTGGGHAKWTVMVYMAANNNLEPDSIINLMEMAAVGSTPDVNIVVQITRPATYTGFYGEWGGTRRFLITKSTGGLSTGDFQISPTRFASYLNAVAPKAGLTPDQVAQMTRGSSQQEEQAALQISVPVIDPQAPLTPLQLASVQDLGTQVNSADGATLAGFGTWAVQNYPADHYGLIMWDHGGGWSMIGSDDTLGPAGMSMPAFGQALSAITTASGRKLDFVGFDACLMAQLPVELTVQPYASYELAAEELVPGFGLDYTPALSALEANPTMSATDFGKAAVDAFAALYSGAEKKAAQSFDLGITDLSKLDGVVTALSTFDAAIKASPGNDLKTVATARGNAQQFGSVGESAAEAAAISSIDLGDFMRLVKSLSADSGVKQAAQSVIDAEQQLVVYHRASSSLPNATGLSVFFPADSTTFAAANGVLYRSEYGTSLAAWQDTLDTFYGVAAGAAASGKVVLQVTSVSTTQKPGSIHDTPVIAYSLNGRNIVGVSAYVIYSLNPQTSVVLDQFPVTSTITTADGSQVNAYPDGQTSNDFYWNTKIPRLSDGAGSELVLLTTNPRDQQHGFIRGLYTNAVTGTQTDSSLVVNLDTGQSSGVWSTQGASTPSQTIAQITPRPGDTFEPIYRILDPSGAAQDVPSGMKFTFGATPLQVTAAPGPDGTYTVLLSATDAAGNTAFDAATLTVRNAGLDASLQGFKDLGVGLSFLYPWAWTDAQRYQRADGSNVLYVTDLTGTQVLSAVAYRGTTSLADLQARVMSELKGISGVSIGQAAPVMVGATPGTSISYQYRDSSGAQVAGTAVAVYVAATGQGYLMSLEVPQDQAASAGRILDGVLASSQFFAPRP